MSHFAIARDKNENVNGLNNDLLLISKWVSNLKMLFNSEPSKPAQEVLFSITKQDQINLAISFNSIQVERTSYRKNICILLDEKLYSEQHVDKAILKTNEGISVIKRLRHNLQPKPLVTRYKVF